MLNSSRIIFYHTHSSSARTRFLFFKERNSVLGFSSLPDLSVLLDDGVELEGKTEIQLSPEEIMASIEDNISGCDIRLNSDFHSCIDAPDQIITVFLARLADLEPPFEQAEKLNAEFRELPFLRMVHPVELVLLQKAYYMVMG